MRSFTILIAAVLVSNFISAQCVVDPSVSHGSPGVYPDSAVGIPHAYVGTPYTADFQFLAPLDTTYFSLPAHIDSIQVTGVTGLPSGFSYSCTPSSCTFPGGSYGCMQITSSGPSAGQVGSYPLVVNIQVIGTVATVPTSLPTTNDNYTLIIDASNATGSIASMNFGVSQNTPNPFSSRSEIRITSPRAQKVSFKVYNLIGIQVYSTTLDVLKGTAPYTFSPESLDPGIYIYSVSDGKNSVTRRMVISADK